MRLARVGVQQFFCFNGWAKGIRIIRRMLWLCRKTNARAESGGIFFFRNIRGGAWCWKGGSIDVNGRGTLLTTEEVFAEQGAGAESGDLRRKIMRKCFREIFGRDECALAGGMGLRGTNTHGPCWTT